MHVRGAWGDGRKNFILVRTWQIATEGSNLLSAAYIKFKSPQIK